MGVPAPATSLSAKDDERMVEEASEEARDQLRKLQQQARNTDRNARWSLDFAIAGEHAAAGVRSRAVARRRGSAAALEVANVTTGGGSGRAGDSRNTRLSVDRSVIYDIACMVFDCLH